MAMSMEAAVNRQRKETRRMKKLLRSAQAALRDKAKEREMRKRKKQSMLGEQAAKDKMVADFMLFIEAIQKNDTETAGKFDEGEMKNTILSMMIGGGGHNGGFAADDGGNGA
ncbi:hypothetical protein HRI_004795900 [Hibiscus trionum]|uniref:Uncharacterized protein n=1 Tax=Hibiscus trionum TaxID=183268 RepID=A0A9W7JDQ3_HIBTR|nr:hypothetical protein HRI_004795900 [Hibiscus trionum]